MKKILILLVMAMASLQLMADDYTYMTFKNSDGSIASITSMGLTITFEDGKLIAVNGDETLTLDIGELNLMYFSATKAVNGRGDVNNDGIVNITDVMLTVNYVIGKTPSVFLQHNADLNSDGNINITDVMGIINIILGAY